MVIDILIYTGCKQFQYSHSFERYHTFPSNFKIKRLKRRITISISTEFLLYNIANTMVIPIKGVNMLLNNREIIHI